MQQACAQQAEQLTPTEAAQEPQANPKTIQGTVSQNEAQQAMAKADADKAQNSNQDCPPAHVKVYVLGAARKQELICYPNAEGDSGDVFMRYVISKADGFETERAIVERIYLFDLDANTHNQKLKKDKKHKKAKIKRLFDMEEMEFQRLGFIRSKNQTVSLEDKHNGYVLLVSKPSGSNLLDFLSRTLGIATTFGAFAGVLAAD
ncbi:MAG: hypothetical protein VKJ04_08730 [Vampirovibrionales bacterium]|nr:hypothetical protein [Vampirovibrionales bacterium]